MNVNILIEIYYCLENINIEREPISSALKGFFCFIFRHLQIFDKGILPFVKLFDKVSPYKSSYLLLLDSHLTVQESHFQKDRRNMSDNIRTLHLIGKKLIGKLFDQSLSLVYLKLSSGPN